MRAVEKNDRVLIDALYLYNFESVRGLGFLTGKRVLFFLSRLVSVRFESFESAPFFFFFFFLTKLNLHRLFVRL